MNTEIKTYARARAARAALKALIAKLDNPLEYADAVIVDVPVGDKFAARAEFSHFLSLQGYEDLVNAGFYVKTPELPKEELPITGAPKGKNRYINEVSTHQGVVAEMWAICDANPTLGRKQTIDLARSRGIAYGTARTQYQKWLVKRRQETLAL